MDSGYSVSQSSWKQWVGALGVASVLLSTNHLQLPWIITVYGDISAESAFSLHIGLITIGAFLGAILADIFGRKMTMVMTIIFIVIRLPIYFLTEKKFWIIQIFNLLGLGIRSTLVLLYTSEIANAKNRGRLMTLQIPLLYFGVFISFIFRVIAEEYSTYKLLQIFEVIFFVLLSLFHIAVVALFPETPNYLIAKKTYNKAARSLAFFEGRSHVQIEREMIELSNMNTQTYENRQGIQEWPKKISEMFQFKNRRTLAMIISLIFINSASEISLFQMTFQTWQSIGRNFGDNILILSFYGLLLITSIFATLLIDVLKRKTMLLLVMFGGFILAIIGIATPARFQWVLLITYIIRSFGSTIISSTILAYTGDFFSTNIRALAIASVVVCNYLIHDIASIPAHNLLFSDYYVTVFTVTSIVAYFCSFLFVLIFFPNTNAAPHS